MFSRQGRVESSKWIKAKVLLQSHALRSYVPPTELFSSETLRSMLSKYRMVYVKPVSGTGGRGVMRAEKRENGSYTEYRYQLGNRPRTFRTFSRLYASMCKAMKGRAFLIQTGIHLLKYHKRPFDVRVMVQKNPDLKWETTGYIGRVAHPKKIVTNFHRRGKPLPLERLLGKHLPEPKKQSYITRLENLGLRIAQHYQSTFPGFRELGIDIGIDRNFHPWVIEVNTAPDPYIFDQLKDKRMFRKIIRYARANGRFI